MNRCCPRLLKGTMDLVTVNDFVAVIHSMQENGRLEGFRDSKDPNDEEDIFLSYLQSQSYTGTDGLATVPSPGYDGKVWWDFWTEESSRRFWKLVDPVVARRHFNGT